MLLLLAVALTLFTFGFGVSFLWLGYFRPKEQLFDGRFAVFTGYLLLGFGLVVGTMAPAWLKYEVVPASEYTVEQTQAETVWRYDGMEISSDKKYWAEIADDSNKYCVYKTTSYNFFGMWPGNGMLTLRSGSSCEHSGKFDLK